MIFLWVALYGIVYTISEMLLLTIGLTSWMLPINMLLYTVTLIIWVWRSGEYRSIGFKLPLTITALEWIGIWPIFSLAGYNLLMTRGSGFNPQQILLMLSVSITEELFVRGYLLRSLMKHGNFWSIVLSSTVFSLLHGANLLRGADLGYTCIQIYTAFVSGICYGAVAVRTGCLFPTIAAHFLTNITGSAHIPQTGWEYIGLWTVVLFCACWGIWQICIICKTDKEIVS